MTIAVPPIPTETEEAILAIVTRAHPGVDPTNRLARLAIRLAWAAGRGLETTLQETSHG